MISRLVICLLPAILLAKPLAEDSLDLPVVEPEVAKEEPLTLAQLQYPWYGYGGNWNVHP